jgi:hypothetical protein
VYNDEDVICGESLGPRVIEVSPANDYKLFITFNNGEKRVFDAKPLLSMQVFKSLKNKEFFSSVRVAYGTIIWPQDIDYCPDTLYIESAPLYGNN